MFLYRLAKEIGWPSATGLGRRISAKTLFEWEAYSQLEPFGELRADYRSAQVAQLIFNTNVAEKDRRPLSDFVLSWKPAEAKQELPPQKQTVEQQIQAIKIWAEVLSNKNIKEMD